MKLADSNSKLFHNGTIILEDRLLDDGCVQVADDRIKAVGSNSSSISSDHGEKIDLAGGYLAPGFVDLHVHGGDGADFMDGTADAFRTVCRAHARHGTTSLLPTTTVGRHDQLMAFLEVCRELKGAGTGGARILGAHFYGPYFGREAKGAHPGAHSAQPRGRRVRAVPQLCRQHRHRHGRPRNFLVRRASCALAAARGVVGNRAIPMPRSNRWTRPIAWGKPAISTICFVRCPTGPVCE